MLNFDNKLQKIVKCDIILFIIIIIIIIILFYFIIYLLFYLPKVQNSVSFFTKPFVIDAMLDITWFRDNWLSTIAVGFPFRFYKIVSRSLLVYGRKYCF